MQTLHWDQINPATGTPFTWDDPNLFWGDPSYFLEAGDPGFVPYPQSTPSIQPAPKAKHMKHQPFYPTTNAQQILWLENFRNKLAAHAATLGLTTAQCAALIADARWLIYVLGSWLPAVRLFNKSCTAASLEAQTPDGSTVMALTVFTPPALPAAIVGGDPAVVPVNVGALDRIVAGIQTIKDYSGYTDTIGADLGVIGSADSGPDYATIQPHITVSIIANQVFIGWSWEGNSAYLDQLEIQVDRGAGWTMLTFDTTPNYTDTTAFPNTTTKWKYRAIYRVGDHQVGQWSAEMSINVG